RRRGTIRSQDRWEERGSRGKLRDVRGDVLRIGPEGGLSPTGEAFAPRRARPVCATSALGSWQIAATAVGSPRQRPTPAGAGVQGQRSEQRDGDVTTSD